MALLPLVLHGDCVVIQYLRMYECEQYLGRDEDVMFVSFKYYVYLRWPSAETTCQTSGRIFNSMRKKLTSLGSPLAITDDDISRILCLSLEVVLKDLLGASGITSLSVEGSSRIVRDHAVSSAERVLHGTPGMILGCRLDIPDIAGVASELSTLQSIGDSKFVTDGSTGSVNEPCSRLELTQELCVDEIASAFVEGSIDSNDIAFRNEFLDGLDAVCIHCASKFYTTRSDVDLPYVMSLLVPSERGL